MLGRETCPIFIYFLISFRMDVNTMEETMEETRKNHWKRDRRLCLYKQKVGGKNLPPWSRNAWPSNTLHAIAEHRHFEEYYYHLIREGFRVKYGCRTTPRDILFKKSIVCQLPLDFC